MGILKILARVWSFLLGSMRMILFLACLIWAIVELCGLAIVAIFYDNYADIPLANSPGRELTEAFVLLILALIGCYGSFYKHHTTLKAFSVLNLVYLLYVVFLVFYVLSPGELERKNAEFADKLTKSREDYHWTPPQFGYSESPANKLWDKTQAGLLCCGVQGPEDWNEFRPMFAKSSLPYSCCLKGIIMKKVCNKNEDSIFKGCVPRIEEIEVHVVKSMAGLMGVLLFMSILACTIANFNLERLKQARQQAAAQAETISGQATVLVSRASGGTEYARFDNYARQPAVNENYIGEKVVYPSVQSYDQAPPVYKS